MFLHNIFDQSSYGVKRSKIKPETKGPGLFWLGGPFGPFLGQFGSVLKTLSSSDHKLAMQKTNVKKSNIRSQELIILGSSVILLMILWRHLFYFNCFWVFIKLISGKHPQ